MKKILLLLSSLVIFMIANAQSPKAFEIYDANGKKINYDEMLKSLTSADLVFFGELHNNPIAHWLELKVAQSLFAEKGKNLIIGAEMFEADNQLIIDEYMNDLISEKNFEEARLWPNYTTDYKPIVTFAKEKNIPLIATNIPRRYANIVYKKDFQGLEKLSIEAKKYIAPLPIKFDANEKCYKEMIEGMSAMGQHGGQTIAKAQAIKDATMAYFILKNWEKGKLFYHFNGSYHSDNQQGICLYIKYSNQNIKIKTISTVLQANIEKLDKENYKLADFIICVPEDMTTTY
jgi:uncharacterized iron-regulated protein